MESQGTDGEGAGDTTWGVQWKAKGQREKGLEIQPGGWSGEPRDRYIDGEGVRDTAGEWSEEPRDR